MQPFEENAIFNLFSQIDQQHSRLYSDYHVFLESSLSEIWGTYISKIFPHLIAMTDIILLLYQRYHDELQLIKENGNVNDEIADQISEKTMNSITTLAEMIFLLFIYNNFLTEGIFDFKSEVDPNSRIKVINLVHSLFDLFFDPVLDLNKTQSLSALSKQALHVLKYEGMMPLVEGTLIINPENVLELLNGWIQFGDFQKNGLLKILTKVSESWWWADPLASYHLSNQAERHFMKIHEIISKYPNFEYTERLSTIGSVEILTARALSYYYLAEHHLNVAISALEVADYITTSEFLEKALDFADLSLENINNSGFFEEKVELIEKFEELRKTISSFLDFLHLPIAVNTVLDRYSRKSPELSLQQIVTGETIVEVVKSKGKSTLFDLVFLFSLSFSQGKLLAGKRTPPSVHRKEILRVFEDYIISSMRKYHILLEESSDRNPFHSQINQLTELYHVALFIPSEVEKRSSFIRFCKSLLKFAKSQKFEHHSKELSDSDIFKALLFQIKSFNLLDDSFEITQKDEFEHTPILKETRLNSLTKIFLLQSEIHQSIVQYLTINDIIQRLSMIAFELSNNFSRSLVEFELEAIKRALDDDSRSLAAINQLSDDYKALIDVLQQIEKNYRQEIVQGLKVKIALISNSIRLYRAIKHFLLGMAYAKAKKKNYENFSKAKEMFFAIAESLSHIRSLANFEKIAEEIYSFGVMAQELENQLDRRNLQFEFATMETMLVVFKNLLFSV